MRLDERTHEHAGSGQVYSYDGEYAVGTDEITWRATISRGTDYREELSGSVPLSSPGVAMVAEQAVHDDIVKRIDTLEPGASA